MKQPTNIKTKVLALVLTIAALAAGQSAWAASTFSVTSSTSAGITTFTITRSENTAAETVYYRTVSLSAIEGQHFTAVSGSLTFTAGQTSKTVSVTEAAPSDAVYKVYSSASRQYRFELLDLDGTVIAQRDRNVSGGTQFTDTYLNKSITGLAYFDHYGDGSLLSGCSHYLDVAHSGSAGTWVKVGDGGYSQAVHTISTGALYNNNSTLRTYLNSSGTKMYATIYFTQKESQDGYQYIQILADNSTTYDGNDPNGAVNTPSTSLYKACFILSYDPSGSVETNPHTQFFPHRWDYADRNAQYSGNSWNWQEFDYDNAHLYEQEFKSATPSLRAENSGSLVLAPTVNNINVRFDAAGTGGDDWYFKDLKVRLALVDATAPTVLNNYKVSGGRHQKGNIIYVSVPFSELVTVEGTPTLTTTWGTLDYYAGSGSNVLTFCGQIASDATGTFSVSAMSGTVRDLAGNTFSGTVSKAFGITLDEPYVWSLSDLTQLTTDTYEIATKADLYRLANIVNVSRNECKGITFLQTQDIVCDAGYSPIGYYINSSNQAGFCGTYDGQGHTVSSITVTRTGNTSADNNIGLFGRTGSKGTVQNVVLANSTLTGYDSDGGIVGYNYGTVRNCRVESTVTIKAGDTGALNHGGIVGQNDGNVTGCVSAAIIQDNGNLGHRYCGGIAGRDYSSTTRDCLYTGATVEAAGRKGGISGYNEDSSATYANNYYTSVSIGGVNGSDQDGARSARTITLGEGISLGGTETTYDVSGITAYGSAAIGYGGKIYSGAGQTLTLSYTGTMPEGYTFEGFSVNGSAIDGNSFTMPAGNVTVTATLTKNELALADNSSNDEAIAAAAASGKVYEVTLSGRTLYKDGDWNTLCLPFDVSVLEGSALEGATLMELDASSSNLNGNTLTLNFNTATSIEAGKPYLIKWGSGSNIVNPVFGGVTISNTAAQTVNFTGGQFIGTYSSVSIEGEKGNIWFVGAGNTLFNPDDASSSLKALRAYFMIDGSKQVKSINMNFDEDASGIGLTESTEKTEGTEGVIYNLQGQQLSAPQRGINIIGGKKVLVK